MTSRLAIQDILLPKLDPDAEVILIDMGEDQYITAAVAECLPLGQRRVIRTTDLTSSAAHLPKRDCRQDVRATLADVKDAFQHQNLVKHASGLLQPELSILQLEQLVSLVDNGSPLHEDFLISWKPSSNTIPVSLRTIDAKVGFRGDRTYWLVGLTGGLGLSLCAWMARQGARYIAITSRNPKVDENFLQKMRKLGVAIEVVTA